MPVRSSPFHHDLANQSQPQKSNMFCVSYASQSSNTPTIHEEEIYSSLKKVRTTEDLLSIDKHVTMIPLGSPHELHRESTGNGTMIRVTSTTNDNDKMNELIPKMRYDNHPNISRIHQVPIQNVTVSNHVDDDPKRDFEGWSGRAMEGRVAGGQVRGTNNIRGYWERNIQMEQRQKAEEEKRQRPKGYGFPKWRSTDALSASLVASNSISIPVDSRIPEERLRKMEETEREAVEIKKEIQEEADVMAGITRKLSKGKSLDSLNMQVDYRPWYDSEKIKSAVSRESIANIATSREFFENASTRDWRSTANSRRDSMCSVGMAPPLPPKSESIQLRQAHVSNPVARPTHIQNGQHYPGSNVNILTISNGYDNGQQHQQQHQPSQQSSQQHHHPQQQQQQYRYEGSGMSNHNNNHNTSINRLIQQDSPQTADPIEQQEVLLMLYLKQNMDIVQGLGIHIPNELKAEMDDLQLLPVELRICDEEPHRMFSPTMKNGGRYQRKNQTQMNINRQMISGGGGQKYVQKKSEERRQDVNESMRQRVRQNSEMSNSNFDLSSQSSYNHQQHHHIPYGYN